jgi:molybdenum cofactor cytidylyltransferase
VLVDSWLETAVSALQHGGCDDVVVVLGAAEVPVPDGATAITAADWSTGVSASLRAGLAETDRLAADFAVVHVIDTPDVGAPVVGRVLAQAIESSSGLARAWYGDRPGHPVVLARRHWAAVVAAVQGDRGAGAYLNAAADVELVDCSDLASGRDWDESSSFGE